MPASKRSKAAQQSEDEDLRQRQEQLEARIAEGMEIFGQVGFIYYHGTTKSVMEEPAADLGGKTPYLLGYKTSESKKKCWVHFIGGNSHQVHKTSCTPLAEEPQLLKNLYVRYKWGHGLSPEDWDSLKEFVREAREAPMSKQGKPCQKVDDLASLLSAQKFSLEDDGEVV